MKIKSVTKHFVLFVLLLAGIQASAESIRLKKSLDFYGGDAIEAPSVSLLKADGNLIRLSCQDPYQAVIKITKYTNDYVFDPVESVQWFIPVGMNFDDCRASLARLYLGTKKSGGSVLEISEHEISSVSAAQIQIFKYKRAAF